MMEDKKKSWGALSIITENLRILHGIYSIGIVPNIFQDIYRDIHGPSSLTNAYRFRYIIVTGELLFPSSLRIIGPGSFTHSMIRSMILPPTVFVIGNYAFSSCSIQSFWLEKEYLPSKDYIDYICSLYGDVYDDRIEDSKPSAAGTEHGDVVQFLDTGWSLEALIFEGKTFGEVEKDSLSGCERVVEKGRCFDRSEDRCGLGRSAEES